MFDLPRGASLERDRIVACYAPESSEALAAARSRAIAERAGFTLDAEIVSFAGRRRWIRITASVECEDAVPVRIFGMKQDITEEKLLVDRTRYLAEFDAMTGLANRATFQDRFAALDRTPPGRPPFGASIGIARTGGCSSADLFVAADTALYAAKAEGRGRFQVAAGDGVRGTARHA